MEITRRHEIDMGHCLADHDGKCFNPHGHRYVVEATVEGELVTAGPEKGMVMDFAKLAEEMDFLLGRWDHRFAIDRHDERIEGVCAAFGTDGLCILDCPPTAENLARRWGDELSRYIPGVL
ncbi:MAG TPA: 6-carboxytetrahydropterin synthase, partial [Acidimicrobiales bacterium]